MVKAVTYTSASSQLTIYNARLVFGPSSYDGSEQTRRNAVLAIDEKTIDEIQAWETQRDKTDCHQLFRNTASELKYTWIRLECGKTKNYAKCQPC